MKIYSKSVIIYNLAEGRRRVELHWNNRIADSSNYRITFSQRMTRRALGIQLEVTDIRTGYPLPILYVNRRGGIWGSHGF
jgi:hypothetical protein